MSHLGILKVHNNLHIYIGKSSTEQTASSRHPHSSLVGNSVITVTTISCDAARGMAINGRFPF